MRLMLVEASQRIHQALRDSLLVQRHIIVTGSA